MQTSLYSHASQPSYLLTQHAGHMSCALSAQHSVFHTLTRYDGSAARLSARTAVRGEWCGGQNNALRKRLRGGKERRGAQRRRKRQRSAQIQAGEIMPLSSSSTGHTGCSDAFVSCIRPLEYGNEIRQYGGWTVHKTVHKHSHCTNIRTHKNTTSHASISCWLS